ncbi:XRE family transcriptional regulator [Desulfovibrio fairfieldensis]|uniref:Cro/Cl family transcriptional regulator n=1 Tax=Desulfovibrio fairfieldensis TaxID=44742 RepID=A0A0X8JK45_9BACT|nr:XRE family transcriptional regulator [Desulfovibrio fairfieldensis]AMD90265.1 Cro/Cl family transcriptional regulator [Desulfovibrio fairfieldensis]
MNTLGERLKLLRGETSQAAFAASLGIPQMTLSNYETGKSEPKLVLLKTICERFRLNTNWLLFGREPMTIDGDSSGLPDETMPPQCDVELKLIPLVEARISAGQGSLEVDGSSERSYAFRMDFLLRKGNPNAMVLMRVAGDSMQPEICHGDVVLIDQSKRSIIPGRIFAVGFEEAIYLKRIDMLPGKVILKSVNEECYPPVELSVSGDLGEQFRVIGQVLWSGREYR